MIAYIERNRTLSIDEKKIVKIMHQKNIPIVYFSKKQMARNKIDIKSPLLVAGGLSSMKKSLSLLNIEFPNYNTYPEVLSGLYGRTIEALSLRDVGTLHSKGFKFFIKPYKGIKDFTGFITGNYNSEGNTLDHIIRKYGGDYMVYVSTLVEIAGEYRAYVQENNLLGYSQYDGENDELDENIVDLAVEKISTDKSLPKSYAIDFALLEDGSTVVLEMNEGFSIDSYDISAEIYTSVLTSRWKELMDL